MKLPIRVSREQAAKPKESDIQRLILDWLAAKRIWAIRLNTGAMAGSHNGKRWFVRFGKPGMADIFAIGNIVCGQRFSSPPEDEDERALWEMKHCQAPVSQPCWIEVKAPKGVQSDDQKRFQAEVEEAGMTYILARSLEDVQKVIE